jgi:cation diffusion facilitator CzcD-associated flavoprotein CzcO
MRHDANDIRPRRSRRVARRVAIIGAGPGGICTGVSLRERGHHDFVILEQAAGIGGTWFHNRYPGAECDIKSHLYSFSFAPNPAWSCRYARQPEIKAYLEDVVDRFGLTPHLRLSTTVRRARWDDDAAVWHVTVANADGTEETLDAEIVVSAIGMFGAPVQPDVPGLDRFRGTMFHSAQWADDHDLTGESAAVIGSAASAVQLVPEIAPIVRSLAVYQRTPNWVSPKEDDPYSEEELAEFAADPGRVDAVRDEIFSGIDPNLTFADPDRRALAEQAGRHNIGKVDDPALRDLLTPEMPFGCKRPLASNVYYPTFNLPHVELVTEPIVEVTETGIVTADGRTRDVDTIILATGFATTKFLAALDVVGRDGLDIDDAWADGAQAFLGITTAGFPNLFMLYGPNTNNGSIIYMIEWQVDYVMKMLDAMDDHDLAWVDVKRDVMDEYNDALQRTLDGVEVWQAGCNGYYRVGSRIVTQWPGSMSEYRARTEHPDLDDFDVASSPRRSLPLTPSPTAGRAKPAPA